MKIIKKGDTIEVSGEEEEFDLLHQGFRVRPGQRITWALGVREARGSSRPREDGTSPPPDPSDSEAFTEFLRRDPRVAEALDRFVRSTPLGTPEQFLRTELRLFPPKFGARGPYAGAYNSLYSRLRTLRVRQGQSPTLTGSEAGDRDEAPQAERGRVKWPHRDRSGEKPPVHFPTQAEVVRALQSLAESGGPVTVRDVSRQVASGQDAENVLLRRRVSAYLSRARPMLAKKLGGTWVTVPPRKGTQGGGWKLIIGGA